MNDSKSEVIIFSNNTQTWKCITSKINIEGEVVQRSHLVRCLCVWLDSDLTFKTHVKKKCANSHDELIKNQKHKEISYYRILCQISGKPLHVTP